jgi:cytoskeletal protein RodZ
MKEIVKRLMLAVAITLVAFALTSLGHAQQADEDPAPSTKPQQKPQAVPQSSEKQATSNSAQQNSPLNKSSAEAHDDQTQDALAFTGRIVEQHGELVLNDPVTKLNYQLEDPSKAKPYIGKHVKILGKLGMKKNTIRIDSIEPVS